MKGVISLPCAQGSTSVVLTPLQAQIYEDLIDSSEAVIDGEPNRFVKNLIGSAIKFTNNPEKIKRSLATLHEYGMILPLTEVKHAGKYLPIALDRINFREERPYQIVEVKYSVESRRREKMADKKATHDTTMRVSRVGRTRKVKFAAGEMEAILSVLKAAANADNCVVSATAVIREGLNEKVDPAKPKAAKIWLEKAGLIKIDGPTQIKLTGKRVSIPSGELSVEYISNPRDHEKAASKSAPKKEKSATVDISKIKVVETSNEELDRLMARYRPSETTKKTAEKIIDSLVKFEGTIISLGKPFDEAFPTDWLRTSAKVYLVSLGRTKRTTRLGFYYIVPTSENEETIDMVEAAPAEVNITEAQEMPLEDQLFDLAGQLRKLADQCEAKAVGLVNLREENNRIQTQIAEDENLAVGLITKAKTMLGQ